jgi:hypothetical protein
MTKHSRILLVSIVVLFAVLLTACGGNAPAESWPGVTVDPSGQTAYVSYNTEIYQVNLSNGTEAWRYPQEPDNKLHFYAPPLLTDAGDLLLGGYNHVFYKIKRDGSQAPLTFNSATDRYVGQALLVGDTVLAPRPTQTCTP